MGGFQDPFDQCPPGFLGAPRGLRLSLFGPAPCFRPPLEIVRARVRLAIFCLRGGTPPGNPIWRLYTYFQRFLMILQRTRVRKGAPRDPPIIERPPPGPPPRPPKIVRAGPRGARGLPGRPKTPQSGARAPPIQVRLRKIRYCFPRGFGELFFGKVAVVPVGSLLLRSKKATPRAPGGEGGVPQFLLHVPCNIDRLPRMWLWAQF